MKNFKHLIIVALAMLMVSTTASAKFRFGVKAGVNVNKLHFDNEQLYDADNRCGFTGGVGVDFTVPVIGIGVDLSAMYSHMDSRFDIKELPNTRSNVGKNFLEIPLNLKYTLSVPAISSIVKPYIFTGPTLALKLSKDDNFTKTRTSQWGWNVGLGLELIRHLQIGAGYTFGMNNVAKHIDYITNQTNVGVIKAKNNYWTITAGWYF